MEELYKQYNYPSHKNFYQILKKHNVKASHKEVQDFIENQNIQQITKKKNKVRKKMKYIIASTPFEEFHIDLLDYQKYSKYNKGNKYILVAIDVFTRFAFAEPIKTKSPSNVLEAFLKIQKEIKPNVVLHDDGNEWKGVFKEHLNEENIISISVETGDHNSLGIIDRFSKTIKTMIYKHMKANDKTEYISVLPKLIDIYNETPHSSLDNIEPINATEDNNLIHLNNIYMSKLLHNKKIEGSSNIKIGDAVRIEKKKRAFQKGYEAIYSDETYKVTNIGNNKVTLDDENTYKISSVMKVPSSATNTKSTALDEANRKHKINSKLKQVGMDFEYL